MKCQSHQIVLILRQASKKIFNEAHWQLLHYNEVHIEFKWLAFANFKEISLRESSRNNQNGYIEN